MSGIAIEYREGIELRKAVAKVSVGNCYIAILEDGRTAQVDKKAVTKLVTEPTKYEFSLWLRMNYNYVRLRDEWRDPNGRYYTESALYLKFLFSKL